MRFLPRLLHAVAAATILIVLYFIWMQQDGLEHSIHEAWQGTAHRIVVFGDDWSDTGKYRISPPPTSQAAVRDKNRGAVWTETLCKELACDFVDNFARSIPLNDVTAIGTLVDSDIFAQAVRTKDKFGISISADFKTQVRQFLEYEQKKHHVPGRLRKVEEWSVFTVSFGLWDLFEYSALGKPEAVKAVDDSIESLFENLNELAQHAAAPIKVVIPKLVDVTFLPRFQSRKDIAHEQSFAADQHKLVFLWTYWNTALSRTASQWKNGHIFMPDPNNMIVDQARAKQLHSTQESDASGAGKQQPLFEHIEQPCLTPGLGRSAADLKAATMDMCVDADRHLFWDDLHLSGRAHELIGRAAASLLRGNHTVNVERVSGSSAGKKKDKAKGDGFALKFPPGY